MERQERRNMISEDQKYKKDEGWLWNTYSWHGGVGRRRAVSNFTLIGKKNGMMDIIRGNMNEKKKKKPHELYEPKRKTCTTVKFAKW